MRRPCKELEIWLSSGAEALPEPLQAHLERCAACQRAWRTEQAYRRALDAVRHEPVPACDLPWAPIQAQLAGRAVVPSRPRRWRLAPVLAMGVFALVVLGIGLLWRTPTRMESPLAQQTPATELVLLAAKPEPNHRGLALPLPAAAPRLQKPASLPPASAPAVSRALPRAVPGTLREGVAWQPSRPSAPPQETPETAEAAVTVLGALDAPPGEMAHKAAVPEPARHELYFPASAVAPGETPIRWYGTEPSVASPVASLPLSPLRPLENTEVVYLPFRYGTRDRERTENDARMGSF